MCSASQRGFGTSVNTHERPDRYHRINGLFRHYMVTSEQQENSVIYGLNCLYSMKDLHLLFPIHLACYGKVSVQQTPPDSVPPYSNSGPQGLSGLMNDRFERHSDYIGTLSLQRGRQCDCIGDL